MTGSSNCRSSFLPGTSLEGTREAAGRIEKNLKEMNEVEKYALLVQEPSEWKMYNDEVSVVASATHKEWASSFNLLKPKTEVSKNGKIKIGFLQDRLVENSPYKIQYTV